MGKRDTPSNSALKRTYIVYRSDNKAHWRATLHKVDLAHAMTWHELVQFSFVVFSAITCLQFSVMAEVKAVLVSHTSLITHIHCLP